MPLLLRAILILPGTVAVVVPAVILVATGAHDPFDGSTTALVMLAVAALAFGLGLALAVSTVRMFVRIGRGTPAPWDPPKGLVVAGVYRHVRNPMITGMILILLGEAALFRSWPLFAWAAVFWLGNLVYLPLVEEPGLEKRFGEPYRRFKANVPRWIPRWTPWEGD